MESWDADYFDMEVPAHVTIRKDLTGAIRRRYMAERYARGELNQIVK